MRVVTNFFRLKKSFDRVHVYLVRIYSEESDDKIAYDQSVDKAERFRIVRNGIPQIRRKKERLMKRLFENQHYLFDGKQHFVVGFKVESLTSNQFEDGIIVSFEYQESMNLDNVVIPDVPSSNQEERKESKEEHRLLNVINRDRLQKAKFTKLSPRGKSWFDERGALVFNLSFYICS